VPVCPEVEIGLGVPRDTLRLVGDDRAPRLVVERTGEDLTARMQRFAAGRLDALAALDLDGYILKRASPSCGLFRVRVYGRAGVPGATGRGLFASALVERLPALPVEEEGRLTRPRSSPSSRTALPTTRGSAGWWRQRGRSRGRPSTRTHSC
jgi:uncharacterized protein YbbK (DUF523 family)